MSAARAREPRREHGVHGRANDLVAPDWAALTNEEVAHVIERVDVAQGAGPGVDAQVTWSSPRPMSAAALVRCASGEVLVKRHHQRVRTAQRLRVEHAFAAHLRARGQALPRVVRFDDGDTVLRCGEYLYEVHELATGLDLYRESPSWHPFASLEHAHAAGTALARFHLAAQDFAHAATPPGVLSTSLEVVASAQPVAALHALVRARPGLARAVASRALEDDVERFVAAPLVAASPYLRGRATQWTHGDWHPSNMTWSSPDDHACVTGAFDLSLANRTTPMHDLAIALERSVVDWLDLAGRGEIRADLHATDALLDGYDEVRPLRGDDPAALVHVLPIAHVEYSLSEIEYFADVVQSAENTDLAYDDYFIGHVRWFADGHGADLIDHVRGRWR